MSSLVPRVKCRLLAFLTAAEVAELEATGYVSLVDRRGVARLLRPAFSCFLVHEDVRPANAFLLEDWRCFTHPTGLTSRSSWDIFLAGYLAITCGDGSVLAGPPLAT